MNIDGKDGLEPFETDESNSDWFQSFDSRPQRICFESIGSIEIGLNHFSSSNEVIDFNRSFNLEFSGLIRKEHLENYPFIT